MPIFEQYMRGQQLGAQQGLNALQRAKMIQEQQRQQQLRNVLSQAVTPAVPGQTAMPAAPAMGPIQPGAAPLPEYPEQAAVQAQPARFDLQRAIPALAQAGLGPEALQLEMQKQKTLGGIGTYNPRDYTPESWSQFMKTGDPGALQRYTEKTVKFGGVEHMLVPGRGFVPLSTLEEEATGQATIAAEKKAAQLLAGTKAAAVSQLPTAELSAEKTKTQIDSLLKHPGLESAFGVRSYLPAIRGSDRADFEAMLEKLQSTIFIDNRSKLKGGGSITDYEGRQAAQAEIAMSQAQSADQFKKSMEDYKYWVDRGLEKLRGEAGKQPTQKYKIGQIVTAPNGKRVIIRSLTPEGEPDDVDLVE